MTIKLQSQNHQLASKARTILFSSFMGAYWFYTSLAFGYSLAKLFYNVFNHMHKNSLSKRGQLKKKIHLKNLLNTSIRFCLKWIQNWLLRILQKFLLFLSVLYKLRIGILTFLKKILKSPFKWKRNFRLFKILLNLFAETFLELWSVRNEVLFLNHLTNWLIYWRNIIRFFMKESLWITYGLYFILLGIFGLLLGFLLGLYRRNHELEQAEELYQLYLLFLLLLLNILSQKAFHDTLYLPDSSVAPNTDETFDKFSLQPLPQIETRPLKLILKKTEQTEQIPQIPFPIFDDTSVNIQVDFIWKQKVKYKFELFQFYQDLNQKIKH